VPSDEDYKTLLIIGSAKVVIIIRSACLTTVCQQRQKRILSWR